MLGPSTATPTGWQEADVNCAARSPNFCSRNQRKSLSKQGRKAEDAPVDRRDLCSLAARFSIVNWCELNQHDKMSVTFDFI